MCLENKSLIKKKLKGKHKRSKCVRFNDAG